MRRRTRDGMGWEFRRPMGLSQEKMARVGLIVRPDFARGRSMTTLAMGAGMLPIALGVDADASVRSPSE
jgi:multidrug efflux pump subunit AcrB